MNKGGVENLIARYAGHAKCTAPRLIFKRMQNGGAYDPIFHRIIVDEALLGQSEEQIKVIIAHEVGHVVQRQALLMQLVIALCTMATTLTMSAWTFKRSLVLMHDQYIASIAVAIICFCILGEIAGTVLTRWTNPREINREFEADQFAARMCGQDAVIRSLQAFSSLDPEFAEMRITQVMGANQIQQYLNDYTVRTKRRRAPRAYIGGNVIAYVPIYDRVQIPKECITRMKSNELAIVVAHEFGHSLRRWHLLAMGILRRNSMEQLACEELFADSAAMQLSGATPEQFASALRQAIAFEGDGCMYEGEEVEEQIAYRLSMLGKLKARRAKVVSA